MECIQLPYNVCTYSRSLLMPSFAAISVYNEIMLDWFCLQRWLYCHDFCLNYKLFDVQFGIAFGFNSRLRFLLCTVVRCFCEFLIVLQVTLISHSSPEISRLFLLLLGMFLWFFSFFFLAFIFQILGLSICLFESCNGWGRYCQCRPLFGNAIFRPHRLFNNLYCCINSFF